MSKQFTAFSNAIARATGKPVTFLLCVLAVVVWGFSGFFFHFSDTWQLVINTSTTIVTFLMVFLIQSTQNRDGAAIQAKLDELIRASAAQNAFIGIEHLTEEELDEIRARCEKRAKEQGRAVGLGDKAQAAAAMAEERANRRASAAAEESIT
jgi:low affinity Fe/Cu permease